MRWKINNIYNQNLAAWRQIADFRGSWAVRLFQVFILEYILGDRWGIPVRWPTCQCSEENPHSSSTGTSTAIKDWFLRAERCIDEWSESSQCVSAWGGAGLQQVVKWGDALPRPLRWEHTGPQISDHPLYTPITRKCSSTCIKMDCMRKHPNPLNEALLENMTVAHLVNIFSTFYVNRRYIAEPTNGPYTEPH
jgi:hypothetical protein